jgi:hypothetical protein
MTRDIAPGSANYFDDVISYRRLLDFVQRANLSARDWPEPIPPVSALRFDAATMAAALGGPVPYGDTGASDIIFPGATGATVSAFTSGGGESVSFATSGGVEGIGVAGGIGGNSIFSLSGAGLSITMSQKAKIFAVSLNQFGTTTLGPLTFTDRAEFRFYDGAVLKSTIVKLACKPDGGVASFSIDVGIDFNKIEIRALSSAESAAVPSAFYLSEYKACVSGTCTTSFDSGPAPAGNRCP